MLRHFVIGSLLPSRRIALILTVSAFTLPLAGCGGDGTSGTNGGGQVILPTPTPSPSPTATPAPTPTPSPTATPTPTPASWTAAAAALYDDPADIASCKPGTLREAVKTEFLTRVNALRALHNLAPVTYSSAEDVQVQQSALIMSANRALSHEPPTSWACYTTLGAQGAASSNLIGAWGNGFPWMTEDDNLAGWMNERNSATIGHRRWILDPFLGKISYGRVAQQAASGFRSDAASMKVIDFTVAPGLPASVPAFVAYPYGDYPLRYFGPNDILSFSVIATTTNRFGANSSVNFSNATVQVSTGSTNLTVTDVSSDNSGYGVPNSIQWKVAGLQSNVTYTVRITGVTSAPSSSYQYTFRIVP